MDTSFFYNTVLVLISLTSLLLPTYLHVHLKLSLLSICGHQVLIQQVLVLFSLTSLLPTCMSISNFCSSFLYKSYYFPFSYLHACASSTFISQHMWSSLKVFKQTSPSTILTNFPSPFTYLHMSISNLCSSFSCTHFTTFPSPTYLHVHHQLSFLSILYKQVLVLISLTPLLFQLLPTCMSASNLRIWASVDISFLYTRSWYCLFSCFCSSFSSLRSCFLHTHTRQGHT